MPARAPPLTLSKGSGDLVGALLGGALQKAGLLPGGSSTASSSTASVSVAVNPAITVLGAGSPGTVIPTTSGSPISNPSTTAQALGQTPYGFASYGPGAWQPTQAEVDLGQAKQGGGVLGILDGIDDWMLWGGAALIAFFLFKG